MAMAASDTTVGAGVDDEPVKAGRARLKPVLLEDSRWRWSFGRLLMRPMSLFESGDATGEMCRWPRCSTAIDLPPKRPA